MTTQDTIVAISSTLAACPRIILRLSGPRAAEFCFNLTQSQPQPGAKKINLTFSNLTIPSWLYFFRGPKSVTGEDIAEFHIPGNPLLAKFLLNELIQSGARQAEPGEFTARSYFNGRIDLTEAEGVAAAIAAQNEQELTAARQLLSGELARRLQPPADLLVETLALIEANIDFSEEDISFLTSQQLLQRIDSIDLQLKKLLAETSRFDRLTHEPRIVLVGRPNAGKSTLLNALAGEDRAIVSDQAGTTRDAIWANVHLPRGIVRMIDVAGIEDNASDEISHSMQQQALRTIEQADIIVLVRDCMDERPSIFDPRPSRRALASKREPSGSAAGSEFSELTRTPDLRVATKIDVIEAEKSQILNPKQIQNPKSEIQNLETSYLPISAVSGENLDRLRDRLDAIAFGSSNAAAQLTLNARHVQAIVAARESLARAKQVGSPEILAMELRESLDLLGEVLGSVTPDDVLGKVFATFCIGK